VKAAATFEHNQAIRWKLSVTLHARYAFPDVGDCFPRAVLVSNCPPEGASAGAIQFHETHCTIQSIKFGSGDAVRRHCP
jgi:hypothetical protein